MVRSNGLIWNEADKLLDLLNCLGAIPLEHKLYNHQIASQKLAFLNRAVSQSGEKTSENFLHQSDYTLLGICMEDRYEPSPCIIPATSVAVIIETNSNSEPVTPKRRRISTARSQHPCKQPLTPRKSPIRPGMVYQRLGLFTPTTARRHSASRPSTPSPHKRKAVEDIGLNTPPSTMQTSPHSPPSSPKMRVLSSKSPAARRLMAASIRNKISKAMTDEDPFGGFLSNLSLNRGGVE